MVINKFYYCEAENNIFKLVKPDCDLNLSIEPYVGESANAGVRFAQQNGSKQQTGGFVDLANRQGFDSS
jgi:hypothetical protein